MTYNRGMVRGKWLLFGGVVILAAAGAGSFLLWRQQNVKPPAPPAQATPQTPAITTEVSAAGKIQAQKVVNVSAPIDGTIESFTADVGQDVVEGQLLAHLRNTRLDASFEAATSELNLAQTRVQNTEAAIIAARLEASRARADASRAHSEFDRAGKLYERQKMLYAEGATPRLVYEKAQRDYNVLKDESESKEAIARQMEDRLVELGRALDTFKRMLDDKSEALEQAKSDIAAEDVRAPVDGVIIARRGQPGEEVTRQMEDLFRIATALSSMEVVLEPAPQALPRIRPGQIAAIHVAEMPEPISGTVREISGSRVIVEFISPTPLIKPGLSAQVTIKLT